jgi:hypothetical protein
MGVELSCHENTNVRRLYSQLVSSRRLDIISKQIKGLVKFEHTSLTLFLKCIKMETLKRHIYNFMESENPELIGVVGASYKCINFKRLLGYWID